MNTAASQAWTWSRLAVLSGFAGLVALGGWRHEMWRDEVFPWLLAAQAATPAQLWEHLRHDGATPGLWHGLLWLVSRLTTDVRAMQVVHAVAAVTAMGLVVRFAPYRLPWVVAMGTGYFLLYEHAVIARSYVLGWLAMVWFCVAARARPRSYLGAAVALAALANTSLVGTVVALGLATALAIEWPTFQPWRLAESRQRRNLPVALAIFGLALLLVAAQMAVKHQHLPQETLTQLWQSPADVLARWRRAAGNLWCGLIPLPLGFPILSRFFWGYNFVQQWLEAESLWLAGLGALLWVGTTLSLPARSVSRWAWMSGSGLLLLFNVLSGYLALRHVGYYFLLYVVCDWLGRDGAGSGASGCPRWLTGARRAWLGGVLAVHAVSGLYAWAADYRDVFSGGLHTARLLREQGLDQRTIYALGGSELMPVSAYLGRPLRFLSDGELRHFVLPVATNMPSVDVMMSRCLDECILQQKDAVVVSAHALEFSLPGRTTDLQSVVMLPWPEAPAGVRLWVLPRIEAIVTSESYFCLRLDYEPQVSATVK